VKKIEIYTDGACRGNPGPGGWGVLLIYEGIKKTLYGGAQDTTNNRMEMQAVIEALKALKSDCEVSLYTDSKYVMDGINKWLPGWKKRDWQTSNKKPVKNRDLWEILDIATQSYKIEWHWVKGHTGNPGNEKADSLANRGIDEL
jgi:ribonuclease HI|tara:strand:+ start:159 stop:590 length:432 start_codon:yes stop_codon:yes gene_type:complete